MIEGSRRESRKEGGTRRKIECQGGLFLRQRGDGVCGQRAENTSMWKCPPLSVHLCACIKATATDRFCFHGRTITDRLAKQRYTFYTFETVPTFRTSSLSSLSTRHPPHSPLSSFILHSSPVPLLSSPSLPAVPPFSSSRARQASRSFSFLAPLTRPWLLHNSHPYRTRASCRKARPTTTASCTSPQAW